MFNHMMKSLSCVQQTNQFFRVSLSGIRPYSRLFVHVNDSYTLKSTFT